MTPNLARSGFVTVLGLLISHGFLPAQVGRDSLGVQLFDYPSGSAPAGRWSVQPQPAASTLRTQIEFSLVADVRFTRSGATVVADNASSTIFVFDTTGRVRFTAGRKGSGPGEFSALWGLAVLGDSIVGFDGVGAGQVFGPDGRYVRSILRPRLATSQRVQRVGLLADGAMVAYAPDPTPPPEGRSTGHIAVVVLTDGDAVTLMTLPARERYRSPDGRTSPVMFGPRTHLVTFGEAYCGGYSDQYIIWCYHRSGRPSMRLARDVNPGGLVTSTHRAAYFAGVDHANPGPRAQEYREAARRDAVFADRLPAFGRVIASRDGNIWVGPTTSEDVAGITISPVPNETTRWSVYTQQGRWLSDVVVPAGFRLMDAREDLLVGVVADKDGQEGVAWLRLRR